MGPDLLRADLAELYPQFGLRVAHAGLALVAPTDAELLELAAIAAELGGVVEPGREGELLAWPLLDEVGAAGMARHVLEHGWRLRESPTSARWRAPFAVLDGGRAVGHAVLARQGDAGPGTVSTAVCGWVLVRRGGIRVRGRLPWTRRAAAATSPELAPVD